MHKILGHIISCYRRNALRQISYVFGDAPRRVSTDRGILYGCKILMDIILCTERDAPWHVSFDTSLRSAVLNLITNAS